MMRRTPKADETSPLIKRGQAQFERLHEPAVQREIETTGPAVHPKDLAILHELAALPRPSRAQRLRAFVKDVIKPAPDAPTCDVAQPGAQPAVRTAAQAVPTEPAHRTNPGVLRVPRTRPKTDARPVHSVASVVLDPVDEAVGQAHRDGDILDEGRVVAPNRRARLLAFVKDVIKPDASAHAASDAPSAEDDYENAGYDLRDAADPYDESYTDGSYYEDEAESDEQPIHELESESETSAKRRWPFFRRAHPEPLIKREHAAIRPLEPAEPAPAASRAVPEPDFSEVAEWVPPGTRRAARAYFADQGPRRRLHFMGPLAFFVVTGLVFGAAIIFLMRFVNDPVEAGSATLAEAKATVAPTPAVPSQLAGLYINLDYPAGFDALAQTKVQSMALEEYRIASKADYKKFITVAVTDVPSGRYEDDSSYRLRLTQPESYAIAADKAGTAPSQAPAIMVTKIDKSEYTLFAMKGTKLLTVAVTSTSEKVSAKEIMDVIKPSIRWKQ